MHISSQKLMYEVSLCKLVQIGGSSFKNSPISKVDTGL